MTKSIFNLDIHESTDYEEFRVTRVPGGWIYRFGNTASKTMTSTGVFVPTEK